MGKLALKFNKGSSAFGPLPTKGLISLDKAITGLEKARTRSDRAKIRLT